jgi:uncharacterized protein
MPNTFPARWATLLKTRKRDGTWVATPVNLLCDGAPGWFSTPATTGKVKRLRYTADVEIAPCTPRGRPTGPAFSGRARLLEGAEAARAHRVLAARHRVVFGALVPLELRLKRTHARYYEVGRPASGGAGVAGLTVLHSVRANTNMCSYGRGHNPARRPGCVLCLGRAAG